MGIVFFGTPAFAVPSLEALLKAGEDVKLVVTQADKPKGRGHVLSPPPVKETALKSGLRVIQPPKLKDPGFLGELKSLRPEFLAVVAYGRLLPPEVLRAPSSAPVNLHASLLPKYRGAAPIPWAIIKGEKETGVATMLMTEGLDEGDILLEERVAVTDEDTAGTLSERLSQIGAGLLVRTLKGLREGSIEPRPQTGEPTYAPPLKKGDGKVNWSKSAVELSDFVRGMHPWPGAYCVLAGESVTLLKTRPVSGKGAPGRIHAVEKDSIQIGTGYGLLSVELLKPAGKKAMPAGAFLQGRKLKEGDLAG